MELPKAIRYSVRLDNTEVLSSSRISLVIENREMRLLANHYRKVKNNLHLERNLYILVHIYVRHYGIKTNI